MNFIQRYQPALAWANELDRFFDRNVFNAGPLSAPRESFHESETAWILRLDLPGFAKPDVTLTVTDRTCSSRRKPRPTGHSGERPNTNGSSVTTWTSPPSRRDWKTVCSN